MGTMMFLKVVLCIFINVVVLEIVVAEPADYDFLNVLPPIVRFAASSLFETPERASTYATIDEKVASKLEELRLIMDVGDPEHGIPKMDPFELLKIAFNVNEPLLTVDGQAYEMEVRGGKSFVVNSMSTKILPPQTAFDFHFPVVWMHANLYSMRGRYMKLLPVIATGEMDVYLFNLNVKGHAKLGVKDGSPYLKEFIVYLDAQNVKTNLRGIQGSEVISVVVNKLVSDFGPTLLRSRKEEISRRINATVVPLVNQRLANMTLQDLISLLG